MTRRLYYEDAYIASFTSRVLEADSEAGEVVLAETAFYPGGGGQAADTGVLRWNGQETAVLAMRKDGEHIVHELDGPVPGVGAEVEGRIDWNRRYGLMRTHSAMHVLSAVGWRDYGAKITGGSMDVLRGRMDFEFEHFSAELTREIEARVNEEIRRGRPVRSYWLTREEADAMPELIRTKTSLLSADLTEIRVLDIEGLDEQADGGTHVGDISEIGTFVITGHKSKGKINKRLQFELRDRE